MAPQWAAAHVHAAGVQHGAKGMLSAGLSESRCTAPPFPQSSVCRRLPPCLFLAVQEAAKVEEEDEEEEGDEEVAEESEGEEEEEEDDDEDDE